jgi:protein tyrosine/serine phosphatase
MRGPIARTAILAVSGISMLGCLGSCSASRGSPVPPDYATTSTGRGLADPAPQLGIEHAAMVAPGIYRGSQPDHADLVRLRNLGFRTVVNLRSFHSERHEVEALGMRSVEIPMRADVVCEAPSEAAVHRFLDVVLDPRNHPVYFHCAHGRDRTGTMAAVYRMEAEGWSPREALEEMRSFGCYEGYADLIRYVANYQLTSEPR